MSSSEQPPPDYTRYSHADLLGRVADLETQLSTLNAQHAKFIAETTPPVPAYKKTPKKPPKPFDPSKYSTRHIALKFAYLGAKYNGFEHHSNNTTPLPTIEEELWRALVKTRLIFPAFKDGQSREEVCWEGCEYSKCGRTDRGVSAFGQVVGLRVRSARPMIKDKGWGEGCNGDVEQSGATDGVDDRSISDAGFDAGVAKETERPEPEALFDPVRDELPYIQMLNRVLPPDIKILAWCPNLPENFSARFNCKERRYRYFFTNPAFMPPPSRQAGERGGDSDASDGWLDVEAMNCAAKKLEGLHDFRNFCKIDASKQITAFDRRIFHAGIHAAGEDEQYDEVRRLQASRHRSATTPQLYYFEVRGSAFLWHQVRHLIAILFLVGQGYEQPSVVDELLDIPNCPSRPVYEIANDTPLVLWNCIFPESAHSDAQDHQVGDSRTRSSGGYEDALDWIYVGSETGGRDPAKRAMPGDDGKYGRNGVMDDLWGLWRTRKIDEVLARNLMDLVTRQDVNGAIDDQKPRPIGLDGTKVPSRIIGDSCRVFDGGDSPRNVGRYVPLMRRVRMETPEVVNARYAARKGIVGDRSMNTDADVDE